MLWLLYINNNETYPANVFIKIYDSLHVLTNENIQIILSKLKKKYKLCTKFPTTGSINKNKLIAEVIRSGCNLAQIKDVIKLVVK